MFVFQLYPVLEDSNLQLWGTFYLFGCVILISLPLVYFIVPETKNVSLELVHHFFTKPKTIFYIDLNENDKEKL